MGTNYTLLPEWSAAHGECVAHAASGSTCINLSVQGYLYSVWLDDDTLCLDSFKERYGFDDSEWHDIMACLEDHIVRGMIYCGEVI